MTLSEIKHNERRTFPMVNFKDPSKKGFRYWILSSLLTISRLHLLNLIDFPDNKKPLTLDVGCSIGFVTQPLSIRTKTIGLDVDKERVRYAKKLNKLADYICCDLCYLPLKISSIDLVVCASVLEHIEDLSKALKEIKIVLKKQGKLVAGYPIETRFLEIIVKTFWSSESQTWNQIKLLKKHGPSRNPHIHKQSFLDIRKLLAKNFTLSKRRKTPNNIFPDFLSIYESSLLLRD